MLLSPRAIHRTPVELWSHIMDFLPLRDIVSASQVSPRWRDVAYDHPSFWRTIRIGSFAPIPMMWATRRVQAARHRPFQLIVDIKSPATVSPEHFPLLAFIATTVPRVTALTITLPVGYAKFLWAMLRSPAPRLINLELSLHSPVDGRACSLPLVPVDVFAGSAPALRCLALKEIALPTSGDVPAFSSATFLSLSMRHDDWMKGYSERSPWEAWQNFPDQIFPLLPHLERLVLRIGGCRYPRSLPEHALHGLARLKMLQVNMGHGMETIQFLSNIPTAHIPELHITCPADLTVRDTAAHLASGPPYCLSVLPTPGRACLLLVLSARSEPSKRRCYIEALTDQPLNLLFRPMGDDDAFATRLWGLTVASSLWPTLAHRLPAYPELVTLVVTFDEPKLPQDGHLKSPPRLSRIVLQSDHFLRLDAAETLEFLSTVTTARVVVILKNVRVEGQRELLTDRYTIVTAH